MTIQKIRAVLWSLAGVFAAGSVAVGFEASRWCGTEQVIVAPSPLTIKAVETPAETLPALQELQTLCQRDLRQSLYDPPPVVVPPPPLPPPPSPPPFTLAGTVIEPGHCRAMLLEPDGRLLLKKLGENVDDAVISDITRDSVALKYQGRDITLSVEKKQ